MLTQGIEAKRLMEEAKIRFIVQAVMAEVRRGQSGGEAEEKVIASEGKGLFAFGDHRTKKFNHESAATNGKELVGDTINLRASAPAVQAILRFLSEMGVCLLPVQAWNRHQYHRRPDLGRTLSQDFSDIINEDVGVQVYVGDRLNGTFVEHMLRQIMPVLKEGLQSASRSNGRSFLVKNVRVGLLNDASDSGDAKVCVILAGERPLLMGARNMIIFLAYQRVSLDPSIDRNAVLPIYDGSLGPLERTVLTRLLVEKVRKQQQKNGV
ncbi:MAG: ethanolamine ammonia-lyase light chain EutC [Deltaproteobacteria bacterium]|jgi:ethanolamine ammonia-lyase small subunit